MLNIDTTGLTLRTVSAERRAAVRAACCVRARRCSKAPHKPRHTRNLYVWCRRRRPTWAQRAGLAPPPRPLGPTGAGVRA